MTATVNKDRKSNFELMRIISMFMIILWHYIMHTDLLSKTDGTLHLFLDILYVSTAIHVNSFILLTGYFNYNKEFKIKKIIPLVTATWFYKAVFALIFSILSLVFISKFDLLLFLLPLNYSYRFGNFYWFINIYIALYLLSPFINILIKNINQKQHRLLLLLSFFLLSVIPYITKQQVIDNSGYSVLSFIFIYLIGSYFGKYKIKDNLHLKNYSRYKRQLIFLISLITIIIINALLICTSSYISNFNNSFLTYINDVILTGKVNFTSPLIIIESICYLLLFETFEFKNKLINNWAKLMFGVYLVHENNFLFNYIYDYLPLGKENYVSGYKVLLILFGMCLLILIISSIIELLRQLLFKFMNKRKFIINIQNKIKHYVESF